VNRKEMALKLVVDRPIKLSLGGNTGSECTCKKLEVTDGKEVAQLIPPLPVAGDPNDLVSSFLRVISPPRKDLATKKRSRVQDDSDNSEESGRSKKSRTEAEKDEGGKNPQRRLNYRRSSGRLKKKPKK